VGSVTATSHAGRGGARLAVTGSFRGPARTSSREARRRRSADLRRRTLHPLTARASADSVSGCRSASRPASSRPIQEEVIDGRAELRLDDAPARLRLRRAAALLRPAGPFRRQAKGPGFVETDTAWRGPALASGARADRSSSATTRTGRCAARTSPATHGTRPGPRP